MRSFGFLAVLVAFSSASEVVDVFFSGGGVRATHGSFVAMCEMKKYWSANNAGVLKGQADTYDGRTFEVHNVFGLSGGAWGASLMAGSDKDPCALVEGVRGEAEWGKVSKFHPIRCTTWNSPTIKSCFNGWFEDIKRWFLQLGVDTDDADAEFSAITTLPFGMGKIVYGTSVIMTGIQADLCHFGMPPARWSVHDGACIVREGTGDPEVECAKDNNSKEKTNPATWTAAIQSKVGKDRRFAGTTTVYQDMTFIDWVAFSSAAWADATAASGAATAGASTLGIIGSDKTTPKVSFLDEESKKPVAESQLCDAGGACNLPMAVLDIIYRDQPVTVDMSSGETASIKQFVTFDYSDNGGNTIKATNQCLAYWGKGKGWALVKFKWYDWGPTLLLQQGDSSNAYFILHVVLFRGTTKGDALVKDFPTMQTVSPNFFTPAKAKHIEDEYGPFLHDTLFTDDTPSPFNKDGAFFASQLRSSGEDPSLLEAAAEAQDRHARRNAHPDPSSLQPV